MDAPDLTTGTTYIVADQPDATKRWHVPPALTEILVRRPGQFEEGRALTASTLRDRLTSAGVTPEAAGAVAQHP